MNITFEVKLAKCGAEEPVFHTRRAHTKSRSGCQGCRAKRLKCDEFKPSCKRCIKAGSDCIYTAKNSKYHGVEDIKILKRLSGSYASCLQTSVDNLQGRLDEIVSNNMSYRSSELRNKCLRDLQHFNYVTASQLGSCDSTARLLNTLHTAIWQHPYLMHMVLAVSNAHAKRLYSQDEPNSDLAKQCTFGETIHWQLALRLYRQELAKLEHDIKGYDGDLDAMMVATCLNTVFMFSLEDNVPIDTFKSKDSGVIDDSCSAYMSTNGFRVMVPILEQVDAPDQTAAIVKHTSSKNINFFAPTDKVTPVKDLPVAFVELFNLSEETEKEQTYYHRLLSLFLPILLIEATIDDLPLLFAFIGEMWTSMRPQITARDPRSLLILSWWLAKIQGVDLWWLNTRAQTQSLAIVECLSALDEPALIPFLEYPASLGNASYEWIWKSADIPVHLKVCSDCVLASRHRKCRQKLVSTMRDC